MDNVFEKVNVMIMKAIFLTLCISTSALGGTRTWYNPTMYGTPIDATPTDWNGINERKANEDAANLFCEMVEYDYAIAWNVEKDQRISERGTMRFNRDGTLEYCDFCRAHFQMVRCYRR